jgi:hypothetical protein
MPEKNPLPNPVMVRLGDPLLKKLKTEARRLKHRGISSLIREICETYFGIKGSEKGATDGR